MRLKVSDAADRDVDDLLILGTRAYGERHADHYVSGLLEEFRRIAGWPLISRERHEVHPPVRLRVFHAHNVFYDVHDDEVEILRVLHHSADWKNLL